jgi:DNA-binding XRE family transcriptional regulator
MVNPRLAEIWPLPRLIRAARGLAGIDQADLARHAGVSRHAVMAVEGDESDRMDYRRLTVLKKLQGVFEKEFGIEFLKATKGSGAGVRFKKP